MADEDHLRIPLELAELLHATLGPLGERLKDEGHPWAELVQRVLEAYRMGRDSSVMTQYGLSALQDMHMVTVAVSEQVCRFVEEITVEEVDFNAWSKELNDGHETEDGA